MNARSNADTRLELDVRNEAPPRRHQLIFEAFHALDPADGFVLVTDHDPKPLCDEFAAEYPGSFVGEPLAEGPGVWRVYIGNRPSVTTTPVAVPMGEVESIATMVLEGLRIRGFGMVTLTDTEAVAAWSRLQDTLRSGHVRRAEPADLGLVLAGIRRVADADVRTQE